MYIGQLGSYREIVLYSVLCSKDNPQPSTLLVRILRPNYKDAPLTTGTHCALSPGIMDIAHDGG